MAIYVDRLLSAPKCNHVTAEGGLPLIITWVINSLGEGQSEIQTLDKQLIVSQELSVMCMFGKTLFSLFVQDFIISFIII